MTQEQATQIREMAMAGKPNAEIIKATGLTAAEVYAYRSKHGITREKVEALIAGQAVPTVTSVTMEKAKFVRDKLTPLLKAINGDISRVKYENRGYHETVIIVWKHGGVTLSDVTADSLLALSIDVLQRLD